MLVRTIQNVKILLMTGRIMKSDRLFYLDCARAVAILLIIIAHYNDHIKTTVSSGLMFFDPKIASAIGISLFIILSGASLFVSSKNNFDILTFYKKRFFSIFPLFYTTYLFWFLMLTILFNEYPFPPDRNPLSFIFTMLGLDGFLLYKIKTYYLLGEWFLGLIIIMYILFPAIRYLFKKNRMITIIVSIIISFLTYYFYNLDMAIIRFPPVEYSNS